MNRKLILGTFIAISALVALAAAPAHTSSQTTVYIAPSTITTTVGQTFFVSIEISDVIDLYGWEFKLKWNSTVLNALNVTEGDFLKSSGDTFFWPIINNTKGAILAACTLCGDIPGVNGSGTLAILEFQVESEGESILDLYDTKLVNSLEQTINHTATDGNFTTDISMYDLNGDGVINVIDIVIVALAFDSKPGDPNWNPDADVNGDGVVNIVDIVAVALYFGESV